MYGEKNLLVCKALGSVQNKCYKYFDRSEVVELIPSETYKVSPTKRKNYSHQKFLLEYKS